LAEQINRLPAKGKGGFRQLLDIVYPPRCIACTEATTEGSHLCANCWRDAAFISGTTCESCGTPLPGVDPEPGLRCDGCLHHPPAWDFGRALFLYDGTGRKLILSLKHADRTDLAQPLASWLARIAPDLLDKADVIAPVPLHWKRLFKRRYNQSAEIARHLGHLSNRMVKPDLLTRLRKTIPQEGMTREERFENQSGAFAVVDYDLRGKNVLLVDDVMTSGATLSACAETLRAAGADQINVLVLARVARAE
jgi:ComF family protein